MKKRRELDALVSNGKIGRRKPTKNGKHELLGSETDSSEEVEFHVPAQKTAVIRKTRTRCQICGTCISVCGFFMILLCVMACGGLIWLQVGLRKELDDLRVKLISVESGNQDTPEALQNVHSKIKDINSQLGGLKDMQTKEDDLVNRVKKLTDDFGKLSKSVSEASKITTLPDQVQQLKQNVATMGSTVSTLQDQVKAFKTFKNNYDKDHTEINDSVAKIKAQLSTLHSWTSNASTSPPASTNNAAVTEINTRLSTLENAVKEKMKSVNTALRVIQMTTMNLNNRTATLEKRAKSASAYKNLPNRAGLDLDEIAVQVTNKMRNNLTAALRVGMNTQMEHITIKLRNISDRVELLEEEVRQAEKLKSPAVSQVTKDDNQTSGLNHVKSTLTLLQEQLNQLNESKADKQKMSGGEVTENVVKDLISTALTAYKKQDKDDEKAFEASIGKLNTTVESLKNQLKVQASQLMSVVSTQNEHSRRLYKLEHKPATGENSESPNRPLHLTGIDSPADLRSYFYIWDGDDDGKVSYDDMKSHVGVHMPPEERMRNYDYNGDGKYSEYELSAGMGFEHYTPAPVGTAASATTNGPELLQVPSIHNKEELRANFYRWDRDGDTFVRYDDLPMFLGTNVPRKHLFKPWDKNGDGMYSLAELIEAFGFPPDTTLAPTTLPITMPGTTTVPTTPPLVKIEMKGITSESDLEAMFTYWDKNRDGFASYDEMHAALGKTVPSPKYLAPYDEDGDGKFTQHELKMAFGFISVPDTIAQGRTQVPLSQLNKKSTTTKTEEKTSDTKRSKRSIRSRLMARRRYRNKN